MDEQTRSHKNDLRTGCYVSSKDRKNSDLRNQKGKTASGSRLGLFKSEDSSNQVVAKSNRRLHGDKWINAS